MSFKVLTFNIHKGFNWRNSKMTISLLRKKFEGLNPDIVFLQEVVGENLILKQRNSNFISDQFNFLAENLWHSCAYSKHAVFDKRHHGNAILSKFPISHFEVKDISQNRFEKRSILFCELDLEGHNVHAYCTHLNLLHRDRVRQYDFLGNYINKNSHSCQNIILAGDFNDWNQKASKYLFELNSIQEAFKSVHSKYAKTYPALYPFLTLDRVYTKGFDVISAEVLKKEGWNQISDHLPINLELNLQ